MDSIDEVVLMYYDSPADAKAFPATNGDLLKRIGEFNEIHLTA